MAFQEYFLLLKVIIYEDLYANSSGKYLASEVLGGSSANQGSVPKFVGYHITVNLSEKKYILGPQN